jgi:hypothetical protein
MDPEFTGFVAAGSYHAALISTHEHRLSFQRRVIEYLDGNKKGIEIEMCDMML